MVPFHVPLKYTVEFHDVDCPLNVKLSRDVPFMTESIDVAVMVDVGVIEFVVCGFGSVMTGCTRSTDAFIHV